MFDNFEKKVNKKKNVGKKNIVEIKEVAQIFREHCPEGI